MSCGVAVTGEPEIVARGRVQARGVGDEILLAHRDLEIFPGHIQPGPPPASCLDRTSFCSCPPRYSNRRPGSARVMELKPVRGAGRVQLGIKDEVLLFMRPRSVMVVPRSLPSRLLTPAAADSRHT
eukprot:3656319-Rhodomonas_salina.3